MSALAGSKFNVTYHWQASPMATNYTVLVHFDDASGNIQFQDDHSPPVGTSSWSGAVSYTRAVTVPSTLAAGTYKVVVGLYYYNAATATYVEMPLTAGEGVTQTNTGSYEFQTGTLTVTTSTMGINGACGSANGVVTGFQPAAELCSSGTASATSGIGRGTGRARAATAAPMCNARLYARGNWRVRLVDS